MQFLASLHLKILWFKKKGKLQILLFFVPGYVRVKLGFDSLNNSNYNHEGDNKRYLYTAVLLLVTIFFQRGNRKL